MRKENPIIVSAVVARKWYSTAEVAVMLGYGLTKTKHLVLSGQMLPVAENSDEGGADDADVGVQ
jgi:hypothetical protein